MARKTIQEKINTIKHELISDLKVSYKNRAKPPELMAENLDVEYINHKEIFYNLGDNDPIKALVDLLISADKLFERGRLQSKEIISLGEGLLFNHTNQMRAVSRAFEKVELLALKQKRTSTAYKQYKQYEPIIKNVIHKYNDSEEDLTQEQAVSEINDLIHAYDGTEVTVSIDSFKSWLKCMKETIGQSIYY